MDQKRQANVRRWHDIAELIRDNAEELSLLGREKYRRDYRYSNSSHLPEEAALRWCKECFVALAHELDAGVPDERWFETLGGDIVIQREPQLYQIDAFMEETLFISRFVAELICREYAGEVSKITALLASFEVFVQWRLRANLATFADEISQPQALAGEWRLEAQRNAAFKGGGSNTNPDHVDGGLPDGWSFDGRYYGLTAREYDIARLAADGKTNAQIATLCDIKLSTVKNTLSRVYAKMQVTNRVEMTIALKSLAGQ